METTVTYRLKGESNVRNFTTKQPTTAMLNLLPDVDMMYATGTYRPATSSRNCCNGKHCVQQQAMFDEMDGW